ncbi:MAG: radical SAM protein [Candidatus Omnitrophica bacterium]|nr:radical SAM protein [Candidatus Omnitrophota bacterium]
MGTNWLLVSIAGMPKIFSDFIPDNGLAILAACLKKNGHYVKILDYNTADTLQKIFDGRGLSDIRRIAEKVFIEKRKPSIPDIFKLKVISSRIEKQKQVVFDRITDDICEKVKQNSIDAVGIKLWAGDGFNYSLLLARKLKERFPDIKVFGGGPQVDIFQEEIFKITDDFDALCFGDGEETIVLLAESVSGKISLKEIPNIIFKNNGSIIKNNKKFVEDMENLPFPEYSQDIYEGIESKIRMFVLDESRGCNNHCAFCIHPVKSGKVRKKTPERIMKEIEYSIENSRVNLFRYAGSSTPADILEGTAKKIIEKNLKIAYTCFGHFEALAETDFQLVRSSGCMSIFFGLESGSPEILSRAMHKRNCLSIAESVIRNCKKAGIFTVCSVIYPAPFENRKTRKETMDFLLKTRPDSVLVQFPGLYPQTVWGRNPAKFNFTLETDNYARDVMTYQIKQFFPPRYWKSLPYRINGMSFKEYARETEEFQKELAISGITTFVSDEAYLLSKAAGFKHPEEFVNKNRYFLFAGLAEEIKKEIETINNNIIEV